MVDRDRQKATDREGERESWYIRINNILIGNEYFYIVVL